jgi:hypothetical protein
MDEAEHFEHLRAALFFAVTIPHLNPHMWGR